jgi:hypothetical protein
MRTFSRLWFSLGRLILVPFPQRGRRFLAKRTPDAAAPETVLFTRVLSSFWFARLFYDTCPQCSIKMQLGIVDVVDVVVMSQFVGDSMVLLFNVLLYARNGVIYTDLRCILCVVGSLAV